MPVSAKRKVPSENVRLTRACLRARMHAVVLSDDILSAVFLWLGAKELKCASRVCVSWREAARYARTHHRRRRAMYVVGGCYGGQHPSSSLSLATVQRYDPFRSEWSTLAELSQARDHLGLATSGGQVGSPAAPFPASSQLALRCKC